MRPCFFYILPVSIATCFLSCHSRPGQETVKDVLQAKVDGAVSCTAIGLTSDDSTLYMQGGGNEFRPSVINKVRPALDVKGMVWIPGGEFSMGGVNPVGMQDGGKQPMNDARPVHRVYVDGFYMDKTEVTNEEFAAFVKATGYITVAEQKPTREEFPDAAEKNLVPGSVVFTPSPTTDLTN
jgi:formylglycine-generating enzyme required for sulfatase activity